MYRIILAFRYLVKRRITLLAIASVALCVFIVTVVMTVHSGIVEQFKEKNHNFVGDCIVSTDSMVGFAYYEDFLAKLDQQNFVKAVSPVVLSIGTLTRSGFDENIGVEIMGIDVGRHCNVTNFGRTLFYNRADCSKAFMPQYAPDRTGFITGIAMMGSRDRDGNYFHPPTPARFEIEISCVPLTSRGAMQKADTDFVNTGKFFFSDDSQSNLARVDGRTIYLPLANTQALCGMAGKTKRISAIFIKFIDTVNPAEGTEKVSALWQNFAQEKASLRQGHLLESVSVQDWKQYRRATIAPMEKEQTMLTLLFIMLGITTVFIIFVVFYMLISHKSKDIGVMRSIGVSGFSIVRIFMLFALLIGTTGAFLATVSARIFLWKINEIENFLYQWKGWQVFDRTVYAIGDLPNRIEPYMLTVIIVSAITACLVGAVIPAMQAARKNPVEILRVGQI